MFRGRTIPGSITALAVAMAAASVHADTAPARPLWELGALGVGVSQQAYPGSDQQVERALAVPYLVYRGPVLRADRGTAGLRALKTDKFELDIGVAGAFAARSSEIEARRGMKELGTLIELGPRLRWTVATSGADGRWLVDLPLRGVFDLNDRAAHRGMALEPELSFQRRPAQGWTYTGSVGAVLADQRLASTLYGVDAASALADRPAYAAQPGLVGWRVSGSFSRPVNRDWRVFGFVRIDSVNGAANEDSPLVRRTTGASAGIGLTVTLARSGRPAVD